MHLLTATSTLCSLPACARRNINSIRAGSPRRHYAQVGSTTFVGKPPASADHPTKSHASSSAQPSTSTKPYDALVLAELGTEVQSSTTSLPEIVEQYMKRAGHVLDTSLPYESRPNAERRIRFTHDAQGAERSNADSAMAIVAHAVHDRTGKHKVTYSSAFAVEHPIGQTKSDAAFLTCAHTLEEIRHDPLVRTARPSSMSSLQELRSGSFVISQVDGNGAGSPSASASPAFSRVSSVLSAMHRGDLLLLSAPQSSGAPSSGLRTLPVNPYPVQQGSTIRAHFVAGKPPAGTHRDGWTPWVGGTWRKWVRGTVVGYKDYAGREAKPGTYDALAHLHFDPPPTPGSSGGPIVDEESGSVIGVVLGTQLVNQVEGVKGWGVPAEMIFEMFSLPGLKLRSRPSMMQ